MIGKLTMTAIAMLLAIGFTTQADARGCLKGAVVGGVAGHYVGSGHGVLGAVGGCLVGRHYGNRAEREQAMRDRQRQIRERQIREQRARQNYGNYGYQRAYQRPY